MLFCDMNSLPVNTHFLKKKCHVFFFWGGGSLEKPRKTKMGEGSKMAKKRPQGLCTVPCPIQNRHCFVNKSRHIVLKVKTPGINAGLVPIVLSTRLFNFETR